MAYTAQELESAFFALLQDHYSLKSYYGLAGCDDCPVLDDENCCPAICQYEDDGDWDIDTEKCDEAILRYYVDKAKDTRE